MGCCGQRLTRYSDLALQLTPSFFSLGIPGRDRASCSQEVKGRVKARYSQGVKILPPRSRLPRRNGKWAWPMAFHSLLLLGKAQ